MYVMDGFTYTLVSVDSLKVALYMNHFVKTAKNEFKKKRISVGFELFVVSVYHHITCRSANYASVLIVMTVVSSQS